MNNEIFVLSLSLSLRTYSQERRASWVKSDLPSETSERRSEAIL